MSLYFSLILFLFFIVLLLIKIANDYANNPKRLRKKFPVINNRATVLSKHTEVKGQHAYTICHLSFELDTGERKSFIVTSVQYSLIVEGDTGVLSYREGNGLILFENFQPDT